MVMVCNDYLASHENAIANLNVVSGGNVTPAADADIVANHDARRVRLTCMNCDSFQPESFRGVEVPSNTNVGQSAQVAARAEIDVGTAKFPAQHPPPEDGPRSTPQFAGKQVQTIYPNEPSRFHQTAIACNSIIHNLTRWFPSSLSTLLIALTTSSQTLANGSGSA
jgi:hypothetical protein